MCTHGFPTYHVSGVGVCINPVAWCICGCSEFRRGLAYHLHAKCDNKNACLTVDVWEHTWHLQRRVWFVFAMLCMCVFMHIWWHCISYLTLSMRLCSAMCIHPWVYSFVKCVSMDLQYSAAVHSVCHCVCIYVAVVLNVNMQDHKCSRVITRSDTTSVNEAVNICSWSCPSL